MKQNYHLFKILITVFLLIASVGLILYFHGWLNMEILFTHFLYLPIILTSFWWKRWGILVAVFLGGFLIIGHNYLMKDYVQNLNDYLRPVMFIIISLVVSQLTLQLEKKNKDLQNTLQELKNTQEKLIMQEKKAIIGDLTYGLAHEVKNSLNAIGLLKILESKLEEADKKSIQLIYNSRDRIIGLIKEISDFARDEEYSYYLSEHSITEIIEEAVSIIRMDPDLVGKKIVTNFSYQGKVLADRNKVIQVLLNLIKNAGHAISDRPDGRILIETKQNKELIYIAVTDNGIGIEKELVQKIWDPFYTTKGSKGTGLGLDISKRIIEGHNGSIHVQCNQNNETCFYFTLLPNKTH